MRKILIVDDNEINRKTLHRILCEEYEVLQAKDGQEALDIMGHTYKYLSAVLLDIVMPVMDGYEVLAKMQSNGALSQIPVIVTTASSDYETEVKALSFGANDFITKPYNPQIIKHRLKNTINLRETAAVINMVQKDTLTGLYNRRTFLDKAASMISAKPDGYYAIGCFDINNFKVINDQYGNKKGDEILKAIAKIFEKGFQKIDGICCRMVADTYAAIYPSKYINSPELDEIHRAVAVVDESIPPISFSVGYYVIKDRELSASAMYDRAAIAGASVKGRFDVHIAEYDEAMREDLLQKQNIVNEMHKALVNEEFEVWFQPQYNHDSGALIGAEALVRWRHPQKGLIAPGEFIPVFESNGFIYELDKYVWEKTCSLIRKWIDEGRKPLPVSVNISRYDVFREDFASIIKGLIEKYRIPVDLLCLEITESAFTKSTGQIISVVKELIDYGFIVEIDDFGSGYSSLNTLKDVPASVLKLDMRFLENDKGSQRSGNILESIVRMSKWLGMTVIAEGVETIEQAEFLRTIGCYYVQGYFYAKPMPLAEYENLAKATQKEERLLALETVESLDNNTFWNPNSLDTLIFNSYVGGACIFEYHNGKVELLRINQKYAQELGNNLFIEDAMNIDISQYMDEANKAEMFRNIERAIETRDESVCELKLSGLPNNEGKSTYIRVTLRVIARTGGRILLYSTIINITEQRKMAQKERAISQQMRAIMANINGGVTATVIKDGVPNFLFANDQFFALLGYTREEYEREITNPHSLLHPDDKNRVVEETKAGSQQKKEFSSVYRIIHRSGEIRWIQSNISVINFPEIEEPVQLAVANDITAEKLAEEKILETDAKLQAILSNVNGGMSAATLVDGKIDYIFVNDTYYSMFGYTEEQFHRELPGGLMDIIHSEDIPMIYDMAAQAEESGASEKFEFRVKKRDRSTIWVRSSGSICRMKGIDAPVHIAVLNDITKERETNNQIRSLNENLTNLMNDTPGGFARMRIYPNGDTTTVYVNQRYAKLRGMTSEEILSADEKDAMKAIHADDAELVKGAIMEMMATGETRTVKCRLRHSSGEYVWVMIFGRITENEKGEIFVNAYCADLSEQEKRDLTVRETVPFIMSAIMKSSAELAFAKDKNFRYLCCTPSFAAMAGQENEEGVIGKTDYDLFPKEIADKYRSDDIKLFEGGESLIDYVEVIPSEDGIPHYSNTSKYILRDTSGEIIGLYGVGRDITESRTAFERLKLLTDSIPGGLATYALSPEGLRIIYFNDGLCRMLGCTREEYESITKNQVITAVFDEDIPKIRAQINEMIKNGTPVNCTYRAHNMKGEGYKWINIRVSPAEQYGDLLIANAVLYDVTEQKAAEEAARIHGEEMKIAMSQMGKMICEYYAGSRTLIFPETYAEKYDIPAVISDVPGDNVRRKIIDEAFYEEYDKFYESILRGDKGGGFEYRIKCADGTYHWEKAEFSTIFDSDGKPVKTIIAVEDTTQQHLQYELEQNRPSLGEENLIVHALFNLTTGETLDYSYRDGSQAPLEERTAFTYGGDNLNRFLINAEEREKYRELNDRDKLLERYARGETEMSIDYRRKMADGDIIWVRNILRMIRKPGGSDILLFEYFYNIEEEKLQELMYKTLVNESYDYVARVNVRNGNFAIIANTGVEYGMPPPQGVDLDIFARQIAEKDVHPDDREMVLRNTLIEGMKENLANKDRFQFTCRIIRPDGSIRYKKITQYYLDRERELIIIMREDVSSVVLEEMRKNELLADALNAANQASLAKTQFLSRMSHELRTPMNAIIGLAALSASELDSPEVMEDSIGKIGMSARYLLSLINDILEMSRIESGRMTLNEALFNFEEFISDVNAIIYGQAVGKGIDYDVVINSYLEPVYIGDITKLQEILLNVLGNSVKFTPAGGKITLAIEQLKCVNRQATLRFTVSDTGMGIDSEFIPHLFEPFSQEAGEFDIITAGTGLGLAITKNLVEMMNGHINVQSIKNMGSVFTIDVQLSISDENRKYLDMISSMNLSKYRALIVDDDIIVCRSSESILTAMGMTAEWVDSGRAAVERVKRVHKENNDFDTIFIDWKMPDMDGIETTRKIRRIVGPDITIIIMTAYDWRTVEEQAREAGVDMFMEKPLFPSSVAKAFEKIFMEKKPKEELAAAEQADFTGRRILLTEDHPLNVEVAKRLLEKVGAEVIVANNGLEALECFATAEDGYFDAILMDIRMPVMDGLTAARSIRNLRKQGSQDIPIIAMTANAFDEDVELSLKSGMDVHLAKPIEPEVLFSTLQRLMKK